MLAIPQTISERSQSKDNCGSAGHLRKRMTYKSYIDRALSSKTDNYPDFQRMIKESCKGIFDVVIVWKLDRFARNRYDSAHYKSMLRKNGVKVISATEAISEGAEGILLESLLEGMAEYYSLELAEKTLRGMTENALACKSNGGILPIGDIQRMRNCIIRLIPLWLRLWLRRLPCMPKDRL